MPIALLIAFAAPRVIKESERHPGHFDFTGAVTATVGMVALVYGFIRAAQEGWRDPLTLASFGAAVVLLTLYILIERRSAQPITPLHMFADRNRAGTYGIMLMLACAIFGMFFFLTLFVQNVLDFSPLQAGLAFLPISAVIAVGAGLTSQLLPKFGPKPFMVIGALLSAAGLAWLTLTDIQSTYLGSILGPMLVFGMGMGLQFVSLTLMALSRVPDQESGAASGLLNATQQVGGSLGLSILVTVFGTASSTEAGKVVPAFLAQASPAERLRFNRTQQLPDPWGDQVLTYGVTRSFIAAPSSPPSAPSSPCSSSRYAPTTSNASRAPTPRPGSDPGRPAARPGAARSERAQPAVQRCRRAQRDAGGHGHGTGVGLEGVGPQQHRQRGHRLQHREVLADAGPRPAAEREPRVTRARRLGLGGEPVRVEALGVGPVARVPVRHPRGHDHIGPRGITRPPISAAATARRPITGAAG